jgi:hypothetical protein
MPLVKQENEYRTGAPNPSTLARLVPFSKIRPCKLVCSVVSLSAEGGLMREEDVRNVQLLLCGVIGVVTELMDHHGGGD